MDDGVVLKKRVVDDSQRALRSSAIYAQQEQEDLSTERLLVQEFGPRANEICEILHGRQKRADPFHVPRTPTHIIDEERWLLDKGGHSRDSDGEQLVIELAEIIKQHGPDARFTDPTFPPNDKSIYVDVSKTAANGQVDWSRPDLGDLATKVKERSKGDVQWKRPSEIGAPGRIPKVFSGGIDPDDVKQGILGNCYFLAAIASVTVATRDDLVHDLVIEDGGDQGVYGVKLFLNGKWVTILIDDLFPCYYDRNQRCWLPLFASPATHEGQADNELELWPLIFEKAWAKFNLSYEATDAGFTGDTTNFITGGTIKSVKVEDKGLKLIKQLCSGDREKHRFLSTTPSQEHHAQTLSGWGLVSGHAYSILELRTEIDPVYRKEVHFVHIRNPWGQGEWRGRFADNDRSWTPELKRSLGMEKADDGKFWMLWDDPQYEGQASSADFKTFFQDVEICDHEAIAEASENERECVVDIFASFWIRGRTAGGNKKCDTFKHNPSCILTVSTSGYVELALYQPDVRPGQSMDDPNALSFLTISLYVMNETTKKTELLVEESTKRCTCVTYRAEAGQRYRLIACTVNPGVESAFWITVAGLDAQFEVAEEMPRSARDEQIMALNTPRRLCCVVCHSALDEYYEGTNGVKCMACGSRADPLRGRGVDQRILANISRDKAKVVKGKGKTVGTAALNSNFGNSFKGMMSMGRKGGYKPLVESETQVVTPKADFTPQLVPQQEQVQPNVQPQYQPEAQPQYQPQAQPEYKPPEPQKTCYYCRNAIVGRTQTTQYGPACNPGCWEKPAQTQQQYGQQYGQQYRQQYGQYQQQYNGQYQQRPSYGGQRRTVTQGGGYLRSAAPPSMDDTGGDEFGAEDTLPPEREAAQPEALFPRTPPRSYSPTEGYAPAMPASNNYAMPATVSATTQGNPIVSTAAPYYSTVSAMNYNNVAPAISYGSSYGNVAPAISYGSAAASPPMMPMSAPYYAGVPAMVQSAPYTTAAAYAPAMPAYAGGAYQPYGMVGPAYSYGGYY